MTDKITFTTNGESHELPIDGSKTLRPGNVSPDMKLTAHRSKAMDKLPVTQADRDLRNALIDHWDDLPKAGIDELLAAHRSGECFLRQPTQSDALREALETARDYVADVAVGNIHFNDNIKAMAAEDLTRIDAALQEQSK